MVRFSCECHPRVSKLQHLLANDKAKFDRVETIRYRLISMAIEL